MSKVECRKCGAKMDVGFSHCLANGWPVCCGETMVLKTKPSQKTVDAAVREIFAKAGE